MKKIVLVTVFAAITLALSAQTTKYLAKAANISFASKTDMENIDAKSNTATSVISSDGAVVFSVLIKSFKFKKALMEEHFNETYMESSKKGMDKSTFKGNIEDLSKLNFTKDGAYKISVKGNLLIHGVTKSVTAPGTITVKGNKLTVDCSFNVKLADYNISVPAAVKRNISETVSVSVTGDYNKM